MSHFIPFFSLLHQKHKQAKINLRRKQNMRTLLLLLCVAATLVHCQFRSPIQQQQENNEIPQWTDTTPVLLHQAYKTLSDISISNFMMQSVLFLHQTHRSSETNMDQIIRNPLAPSAIVDAAERVTHVFADEQETTTMQLSTQQQATERVARSPSPKNPCDSSALYVTYNSTVVCNIFIFMQSLFATTLEFRNKSTIV